MKHAGLKGEYKLIDVVPDELEERIDDLSKEGFNGFNITIPYKERIFRLVDRKTLSCAKAEAANTVKIEDGAMLAHNTDVEGFSEALNRVLPDSLSKGSAIVIGAGGASRAAIIGLNQLGFANIEIVARNHQSANELMASMRKCLPEGTQLSLREISSTANTGPVVLVNCTPIGQHSDEVPEWFNSLLKALPRQSMVFDMVYASNGTKTPVVRQAQASGLNAYDGLDMLANQAALAFEFWTGKSVPAEIMKAAAVR